MIGRYIALADRGSGLFKANDKIWIHSCIWQNPGPIWAVASKNDEVRSFTIHMNSMEEFHKFLQKAQPTKGA